MIVIPLLCFAGITAILTQFLWPHYGAWSLLIALPIALLVIVFSVAMQGHDALDIIVGSLLALFFCFILLPVFARARENRQNAERKALIHRQPDKSVPRALR